MQYSLPITAKTAPANADMFWPSSMTGNVQPTITKGNTDDKSEEPIIDLGDSDAEAEEHRASRPDSGIESPIQMPLQHSHSPIEYIADQQYPPVIGSTGESVEGAARILPPTHCIPINPRAGTRRVRQALRGLDHELDLP